jgi:LAO/AO transport system kinase
MSRLSAAEYHDGILNGNKVVLARAITLVESTLPSDQELATEVLAGLLGYTGKSTRIGITGVPGVGKSTFIESFGMLLIGHGHKVAVLSIDPSSTLGKGSILGDKTRMASLSKAPSAYVRPSPSSGFLGGTGAHTREVMQLCEAAGFDHILVETVGVGQSETIVDQMVDFFLLLMLAGAGDELQGIKRGIMELAHAVVIHKADGSNRTLSLRAKAEYEAALHWLAPRQEGWITPVLTASSTEGTGIEEIYLLITNFLTEAKLKGYFEERRSSQDQYWFQQVIDQELKLWLQSKQNLKEWIDEAQLRLQKGQSFFYLLRQELRGKLKEL